VPNIGILPSTDPTPESAVPHRFGASNTLDPANRVFNGDSAK
jgi:hypothetical protein